jgi:hypothetical protein
MRKAVLNFMHTGKYDELKFLLTDTSTTYKQVTEKLQRALQKSSSLFNMAEEDKTVACQKKLLCKPEQVSHSKKVVEKILKGYSEW